MSTLRIAVWGSGNMAKKHCANAIANGRSILVGVAARNTEAAQGIIDELGNTDCVIANDPIALSKQVEFDALICAIPPGLQSDQATVLAAAGKHLFLEKPVALNLETINAIADAAKNNGVKTQVCHHMRFDPGIEWLKNAIDNGDAGQACLYESRFWMNGDMQGWWKNKKLGGGQVVEQLIHIYDMARYLFGEAKSLSGFWASLVKTQDPAYDVDDNSVCNIQFVNGALGHINGSNCATPNRWACDWRMVFEHLTFESHDDGHWESPYINNVKFTKDNGELSKSFERNIDLHAACMHEWLDAIDGKGSCRIPIEDAVKTHALVFAAAASMENSGQLVEL